MRKIIKRLFDLHEYKPDPDYSEFTLKNLINYVELHKTIAGKDLESLTVSPLNYLKYKDLLGGVTELCFRGLEVLPDKSIKIVESK